MSILTALANWYTNRQVQKQWTQITRESIDSVSNLAFALGFDPNLELKDTVPKSTSVDLDISHCKTSQDVIHLTAGWIADQLVGDVVSYMDHDLGVDVADIVEVNSNDTEGGLLILMNYNQLIAACAEKSGDAPEDVRRAYPNVLRTPLSMNGIIPIFGTPAIQADHGVVIFSSDIRQQLQGTIDRIDITAEPGKKVSIRLVRRVKQTDIHAPVTAMASIVRLLSNDDANQCY